MIWFTSDEHYYHANIITNRFRDQRPFNTVNEMHKTLIKRHNEVVAPEDITYHLGDFSFSKHWRDMQHLLEKLNGSHILILGNHDLFNPFQYVEAGFQSVHTSLYLDNHYMIGSNGLSPTLIHDPSVAGVFRDKFFIHGHTHGLGQRLSTNSFCVSVELTDYYPVPITDITFGG